jgi:hypothetical protein
MTVNLVTGSTPFTEKYQHTFEIEIQGEQMRLTDERTGSYVESYLRTEVRQ